MSGGRRRALRVFGSGAAPDGQLGSAPARRVQATPVALGARRVLAAAAGDAYSLLVGSHGACWAAGGVPGASASSQFVPLDRACADVHAEAGTAGVAHDVEHWTLDESESVNNECAGASAAAELPTTTTTTTTTTNDNDVVQVAAGRTHTLLRLRDGRVFGRGSNSRGELGLGALNMARRWTPITVDETNPVNSISSTTSTTTNSITSESLFSFIACGHHHTLAVRALDGALLTCGRSMVNELGHGLPLDECTLTRVEALGAERVRGAAGGVQHSVAWSADGALLSFGGNSHGECGVPAGARQDCVHRVDALRAPVREAACGAAHTLALLGDGRVMACGSNVHGQLGSGAGAPLAGWRHVALRDARGREYAAARVVCGFFHSMALSECGRLFVWGSNNDHQLGLEERGSLFEPHLLNDRDGPLAHWTVADVATAFSHTIFLLED